MFASILNEIKKYNRIIIHRHNKPDGDALGSQIGLKHIIKENFPEYFVPDEPPKDNQPVNTPVYSKGPGNTNVNPESEEDKLAKQLLDQWK